MQDLQGTEKQVSWAVKIRKDRLERWRREAGGDASILALLQVLEAETRSSWWISYKDADLETVLRHNRGGYDKSKEDMKKFLGTKNEAPPKKEIQPVRQVQGPKQEAAPAVVTKGTTPRMTVGPTRNIITGEIVENDPDLPF